MPKQLGVDFHDGTVQGFWLKDNTFHLLLATEERSEYTLLVHEAVAVSSTGFGTQNIIFDVQIKESHELTEEDMREVYNVSTPSGESHLRDLLNKAHARASVLVVADPSCGANCLVLGQSVELLTRDAWTSSSLAHPARS